MEKVYLAAIAGVVIVVVVVFFLLRRRIVRAEGRVSLKDREIAGTVEAVPPEEEPSAREPEPHLPTPAGIRENVQIGSPIIRVLRNVRVFRNLQIGRGRIEVMERDVPEEEPRRNEPPPRRSRT